MIAKLLERAGMIERASQPPPTPLPIQELIDLKTSLKERVRELHVPPSPLDTLIGTSAASTHGYLSLNKTRLGQDGPACSSCLSVDRSLEATTCGDPPSHTQHPNHLIHSS